MMDIYLQANKMQALGALDETSIYTSLYWKHNAEDN